MLDNRDPDGGKEWTSVHTLAPAVWVEGKSEIELSDTSAPQSLNPYGGPRLPCPRGCLGGSCTWLEWKWLGHDDEAMPATVRCVRTILQLFRPANPFASVLNILHHFRSSFCISSARPPHPPRDIDTPDTIDAPRQRDLALSFVSRTDSLEHCLSVPSFDQTDYRIRPESPTSPV
jgi:hypothetical protein